MNLFNEESKDTFVKQTDKSTKTKDMPMDVDDSDSDVKSNKHVVSPVKPPGSTSLIPSEEDSGFENMDVDESKEPKLPIEPFKKKRPIEIVR